MMARILTWELLTKLALYALVFFAPLFFLPWGVYAVAFNKQFLVITLTLIALFGYLAKSLNQGKLIYKKGNILTLGFLALSFISLIFSLNRNTSIFGVSGAETDSFINILSFILILFLISAVFTNKDLKKIISLYLISISILVVYQFLQLFGVFILPFEFTKVIDFNPVATVYDLTIFLGANLILVLNLLFNSSLELFKIKKAILLVLGLSLFIYLLLINYSLVWILLAVSLTGILILKLYQGDLKIKGQNALIIILTIFVFLYFSNLNLGNFSKYFQFDIRPSASLGMENSAKIVKESYKSIKNSLLGSGPATFIYQYLKFKPIQINQDILLPSGQRISGFWSARFNTASSLFLTYIVSLGALASLLFLLFVLNLLLKSRRDFFLPMILYLTTALLFYNPNYLLTLTLFAAAGIYKAARTEEKELDLFSTPQRIFLLSLIIIILIVSSVFALYYESQRFAASIYYDIGIRSINENKYEEGIPKLLKAVSLDNQTPEYYRGLSQIFLNKYDLGNARNSAQNAINLNPVDSANYIALARVLETRIVIINGLDQPTEEQKEILNNDYNLALENYKQAIIYDPKNPEIYLNIASLHLVKNKLNEAELSLKTSLALKSDYSDSYYILGLVYEKKGMIDKAIEQFEKVLGLNPDSEPVKKILENLRTQN